MEKQNVGWKKNLSVEKKLSVGEFPLPKTEKSGHSLECKTEKRQRQGKTPRAYRGTKKKLGVFFVGLRKKCRLEKKMPAVRDDWA